MNNNIWAVIISGAKYWQNYCTQSLASHAYQTITKHGVPSDKIIVFMYDDVVNDPLNPYPGKLFTEPDGPDVYAGVKIDYRGDDVNAEVIMNVLKGNATGVEGIGTGRVLKSTHSDHVFIYHVGHGNSGILSMPDSMPITKKDLNGTLQHMFDNKMYKKLLFYLESCLSGSMFEGLPDDMNIYALTAASPYQDALMDECYTSFINTTCLSAQFGHAWMSDTENNNILIETIGQQVDSVITSVINSTVCQYGDQSERKEPVSDYQGKAPVPKTKKIMHKSHESLSIKASDVELIHELRTMRLEDYSDEEIEAQKAVFLKRRTELEEFVHQMVKTVLLEKHLVDDVMTATSTITQLDCHHEVVNAFFKLCAPYDVNPYARRMSTVFANLCETIPDSQAEIINYFQNECKNGPRFSDVL